MDSVAAFFQRLPQRGGQEPALAGTTATVRFELREEGRTENWLVTLQDGGMSVSRKQAKADCTMRMERAVFEDLIAGKVNPMAATLRGVIVVEGQPSLLARVQRLIPGPASSRHPRVNAQGPTS